MFCKWCGGELLPSDTKCRRCGKEVPALSDCGGFYDIVPGAKKNTEEQIPPVQREMPAARPMPSPGYTENPNGYKPAEKHQNRKNQSAWLVIPIVIGIVITIALFFVMFRWINPYFDQFAKMQNDVRTVLQKLDSIEEKLQSEKAETPDVETAPVDPVEPEADAEADLTVESEPVLTEQELHFLFRVQNHVGTWELTSTFDLGAYTDTAVVTSDLDEESGEVDWIRYSLYKAELKDQLTIEHSEDEEAQTQIVSIGYAIDETVFGVSEDGTVCTWQYRFGTDAEWADLPEGGFSQVDSEGKTSLSITEAELETWSSENEGKLELRCEISRTNTNEGSLTMAVEGIGF